jgi:Zn ribbon nucleic-acid-binding protein
MKLPNYIVQNIFYRLGLDAEKVKSSSTFVHKAKCPICQDHSQRMYLREYGTFYSVKCHNCGFNSNFEAFIKEYYPDSYDELTPFILESIKDGSIFKPRCLGVHIVKENSDFSKDLIDIKLKLYLRDHAFPIKAKQDSAKKEVLRKRIIEYLEKRKIPSAIYKDFYCMMKGPLRGYIGIPFFDERKENIIHIQGRLFVEVGDGDHPKYMFLRDKLDGIELESKELWGLWRTAPDKTTIICEGTLDACAFENGIATCGATLGESFIESVKAKFPKRIWCVDNFWSDKEGRKLTMKLLQMGEKCFIIPRAYTHIKDANDLLCKELTTEYISDTIIEAYTYSGRFGLIKLRAEEVTKVSI